MWSKELYARLFAEFLGTALLAFAVSTTLLTDQEFASIAIGGTVIALVYAFAHVSGSQFNPAVTLALIIRQAMLPAEAAAYVVAQIAGSYVGGLFGSVALNVPVGQIGHPSVGFDVAPGSALLCETLLTFALAHTVLHAATTSYAEGKFYFGLAIGFLVLSAVISVGGLSGCALNPAIGLLATMTPDAPDVWIYFLGPLLGGGLAGGLFQLTHPGEVRKDPSAPKPSYADYAIEFVGTFLLCFTFALSVGQGEPLASLGVGAMYLSQVYAGGPTSGGHYNPAVTLAVYLRSTVLPRAGEGGVPQVGARQGGGGGGKSGLPLSKAVGYVTFQLVAALVAGGIALCCLPHATNLGFPHIGAGFRYGTVWWGEGVASAYLAYVVLQTTTAPKTAGNGFFGLAIGLTYVAMGEALSSVTGGALNPAVALLGLFTKHGPVPAVDMFAIYWTAPPVGAALAALLYRATNYQEFELEPTETTPLTAA